MAGCVGLILALVLGAAPIWLAARIMDLGGGCSTAIITVIVGMVLNVGFSIVFFLAVTFAPPANPWLMAGMSMLLSFCVQALGIKLVYKTPYGRALITSLLATTLIMVPMGLFYAGLFYVAFDADQREEFRGGFNEALAEAIEQTYSGDITPGGAGPVQPTPDVPRYDANEDSGFDSSESDDATPSPGTWQSRIREFGSRLRAADTHSEDAEYETADHPLSSAGNFLNRRVQVHLDDGDVVFGTLQEVRSDALVIERRIGGGTISVPIKKSRITKFQRLIPRQEN